MVESVDGNETGAAVCRKMSKSISTFVEVGANPWGGSRNLDKERGVGNLGGSRIHGSRGMCGQAARSARPELCSIELGAALATLSLPINRLRGLIAIASLRRAPRNNSMKETAAPHKLVNATDPIMLRIQSKARARIHGKANSQKTNENWQSAGHSPAGLAAIVPNTFDNCQTLRHSARVDPQLLHARNQGCTFDAHTRGSPIGARDSPIGGFQNADNRIALTGFARSYPRRGAAVVA